MRKVITASHAAFRVKMKIQLSRKGLGWRMEKVGMNQGWIVFEAWLGRLSAEFSMINLDYSDMSENFASVLSVSTTLISAQKAKQRLMLVTNAASLDVCSRFFCVLNTFLVEKRRIRFLMHKRTFSFLAIMHRDAETDSSSWRLP